VIKLPKYRIGIDVGSTHTDAVIIDEGNRLIGAEKSATTPDVTSGILTSLKMVLEKSGIAREDVAAVMFGTTHVINAIVQRKGLGKVGVIRIGSPATEAVEPMLDWPKDLKKAVEGLKVIIRGGHEYTGEEIAELDVGKVREIVEQLRKRNVDSVAITSVFSIVNPEHEVEVAKSVKEGLGETSITLSHEIGTVGLLERENATILNAATINVIKRAIAALKSALANLGLEHAKMYFAQNDGTTASAEYIERFPIFTVVAPISNSIRGAYVLTQISDAIVVDTGGTTSNIGALTKGYPRESLEVDIGGVRTNIRAPDVVAVGIAGGTIIRANEDIEIGPESVGYQLVEKGLAWGGDVLTATDIALAKGTMKIDDPRCKPELPKSKLSTELVERVYWRMVEGIEYNIDRVKTSAEPVTVVLVGGGSAMWPRRLKGAKEVIRPEYAQFANAIGAATALVGASVEKAFSYEAVSRDKAIAITSEEAKKRAVEAGASSETVEIAEVEEIAMPYLPGNAVKIRVKATGRLRLV
jgi:N-methylhydantoinase A/oxoprolinase/acetone carboxylase beta subunit